MTTHPATARELKSAGMMTFTEMKKELSIAKKEVKRVKNLKSTDRLSAERKLHDMNTIEDYYNAHKKQPIEKWSKPEMRDWNKYGARRRKGGT
jgi:hypothetical protein